MHNRSHVVDVAVVGAGFAGLSAALSLSGQGASVVVLEARDRVGGRTFTRYLADGTQIDLGGQWLGPAHVNVLALLERFGIGTFPTPKMGDELHYCAGRRLHAVPEGAGRLLDELDRLSRDVPLTAPWTHEHAEMLDRHTFASWLERQTRDTATARYVERQVAGGLLAGEASDYSMLEVLFYVASGGGMRSLLDCDGGAQNYRVVGGPQALAEAMARSLGDAVRIGEPVRRIEHGTFGAVLVTDLAVYQADRVVVAVPPTLAGRIDYLPALPARRDGLTQRMPAGSALKTHAVYDAPFWRDAGLSGVAVTDQGPVSETFDNSPPDGGRGVLVSFAYGSQARLLREQPAEKQRMLVLDHLAELFGARAADAEDYVSFDWSAEPWTRGCFSGHFTPGGWTSHGPALRCPVGALHWAGTETATHWNGYIEGAVSSGVRAASEVSEASSPVE